MRACVVANSRDNWRFVFDILGLSEEQISDVFSNAGKVLNFRLVYDKETGRPKGFGFAEYPDADSAASAVRNLNDYEIMGRKLRVDFSNEGGSDDVPGGSGVRGSPTHPLRFLFL